MADVQEDLMDLALRTINYEAIGPDKGWALMEGVDVYVNPPARCPHCEEWVPTQRIWFVWETGRALRGVWDSKTGKSIDRMTHPHASYSMASICKGNNKTCAEALFSGVAKGVHHHTTEAWFYRLGHHCKGIPDTDKTRCDICNTLFPIAGSEEYGQESWNICSDSCMESAIYFHCYTCFGLRDFYDLLHRRRRCEDCFQRESGECVICGDRRLMGAMTRPGPSYNTPYCERCAEIHMRRCRSCEMNYLHPDLISGYCRRCRPSLFDPIVPHFPLPTIEEEGLDDVSDIVVDLVEKFPLPLPPILHRGDDPWDYDEEDRDDEDEDD